MAITAIDQNVALIAVDMQQGILGFAPESEAQRIIQNTTRIADELHRRGLPVVWVRALGMPEGRKQINPPVGEPDENFAAPAEGLPIDESLDLEVFKKALSGFTQPALHEFLQKHNVTQVLITGLAAGVGVESTARSAFDHGYNVVVVSDGLTDPDPERMANSLQRTMPAFSEIGTTEDVLAQLNEAR
ncbi:cysteine hydrolase [Rothia sp. LK2588]|uniref:cysteine hydrolase family protein n=1 Tax=Rothia sp. LK2588 TaxID=3114369 RepID=UPI0034CF00BF